MPIQPDGTDADGMVELREGYADGLADLDGFSHCILRSHFHASPECAPLRVEPSLDDVERGLFATRAPRRPNGIGLSVVGIESIDGAMIEVSGIDVVDGTPLLDIKPFVPAFDVPDDAETGRMDASKTDFRTQRADDRFQ